ncbi:MAG TPA: hypothetical protein VHS58_10425 [Acetobacteraceae bacterium]|jgi:polyhydroxybutyrate depolymerase|nr:hypothetical protein [Acetobacteraceae bacterium]
MRVVLLMLLALVSGGIADAETCGVNAPCAVAGGTYRVSPPDGPIRGAALFLHGYGSSGNEMMQDDAFRAAFRPTGVLLVLPNGPGRAWHVAGEPGVAGNDRSFVAAVADDVAQRWQVDRPKMWVGGFSVGASEVWDLACHGGGFADYVAISGQFWDPLPAGCDGPPVDLLQIHGLTDDVFPLEGRAIGRAQQGDLFASLGVLRALDQCRSNPDAMTAEGMFVLRLWTSCRSGKQIGLVLHPGGHEMPKGWVPIAFAWARSLSGR